MKKRALFILLLAVLAIGYITMPRMVENTIPAVYYVTPSLKSYENVINCTGTIQSGEVRQVFLQSAIVAEEVFIAVGDTVAEGDLLIKADEELTGRMGMSLSLIRDLSEDIGMDYGSVNWAEIVSGYGLSAAGGAGVDYSAIEALLGGGGLHSAVSSGTIVTDPEHGEIVSPVSGVVTAVDIQRGVPAAAGKAIVTIADNTEYKVLISIREEDVARVQEGDGAKVRGVGFSGMTYDGIVTKIYPMARKALTGTTSETVVDAEVTLLNPDKQLKPGFSAKVEILGGNDYNLITVPYEAIKQDENNNEYVYLYEYGKLKKQVVVTGQELTNEVEILDGVSADSVVVHNPSDAVKEGAMIQLKGRANAD